MRAFCQNCNKESSVRLAFSNRVCNSCNCIINEKESTRYYLSTLMGLDQELGLYE